MRRKSCAASRAAEDELFGISSANPSCVHMRYGMRMDAHGGPKAFVPDGNDSII
jgi:hypothetical protein